MFSCRAGFRPQRTRLALQMERGVHDVSKAFYGACPRRPCSGSRRRLGGGPHKRLYDRSQRDPVAGGTLVTVTGTLQCGVGHTYSLFVEVFQGDGQSQEQGSGSTNGLCNGGLQAWQVTVQSFTGPYHSGKAVARARNFTNGPDGFEDFVTDAQIRLG